MFVDAMCVCTGLYPATSFHFKKNVQIYQLSTPAIARYQFIQAYYSQINKLQAISFKNYYKIWPIQLRKEEASFPLPY